MPKIIIGNKIDKMEDKNYDEGILNKLMEEKNISCVMISAF